MTRNPDRALDRDEAEMVEQTRNLADLSQTDVVELVRRLRARRDRAKRMIRNRTRAVDKGERAPGPDTGARAKNAAVDAKAAAHPWRGPEDRTANTGPVENPNLKIAPSGALHAEGMRAAIARSTGDR